MLAGGEEYFQPPESIDHDSLCRFAAFCRRLRALEKPGMQAITALTKEAENVGSAMHIKEVVAGTVFRCIRQFTGVKRYAYWCLLDRMAKEYRSTFAFLFEMQLADVAADCIEWEDPALSPKYEALLEHWDAVFDRQLVQQLRGVRKKERLWTAKHPEEARRQREEEEAVWDREIEHSADAEGLNNYGEPCLAYMQGHCTWGDNCTLLHPPGLEGSLPPESRMGDWRCLGCGMINRHFRRRCFTCYREKPQYKKGDMEQHKTPEAVAVTKAESSFLAPLSAQFGYDPCDEVAAVKYWSDKLSTPAQIAQYIEMRRRRYQSEIIPHVLKEGGSSSLRQQQQQQQEEGGDDTKQPQPSRAGDDQPVPPNSAATASSSSAAAAGSGKTVEISVPASALAGSATDRMATLSASILEEGVHSPNFLKNLFLLSKVFSEIAAANKLIPPSARKTSSVADKDVSLVVFEVARMVHTSWLAQGRKRPHAAIPFLTSLGKELEFLPIVEEQRADIRSLAESVN